MLWVLQDNIQTRPLLLFIIFIIGFITFQNVYANEVPHIFVSNPPSTVYAGNIVKFLINTDEGEFGQSMTVNVEENGHIISTFQTSAGQGSYSYIPNVGNHDIWFEALDNSGQQAWADKTFTVQQQSQSSSNQNNNQQSSTPLSVSVTPSGTTYASPGSTVQITATASGGNSADYNIFLYDGTGHEITGSASGYLSYTYTVSTTAVTGQYYGFTVAVYDASHNKVTKIFYIQTTGSPSTQNQNNNQQSTTWPNLTLYSPSVNGLTATINGVTSPTTSGASITRINWDWGDGQSTIGWFPLSHTYSNSGTYTIKVTSYDNYGNYRWTSESVTVSGSSQSSSSWFSFLLPPAGTVGWGVVTYYIALAVIGVIAFFILGMILLGLALVVWEARYYLLVIASIGVMIWLYISHYPLWEEIVIAIGIAGGWCSIILFRKSRSEDERNYPTTSKKSDDTLDMNSKDAINSGIKERPRTLFEKEFDRMIDRQEKGF